MNGDELIHKHYILLIDKITYSKWENHFIIELSDGWYPIFAIVQEV